MELIVTKEQIQNYHHVNKFGGKIVDISRAAAEAKKRKSEKDYLNIGYLPFLKTHEIFKFRRSEVTLWAGETKSFKSMFTGFMLMHLSLQGFKTVNGSFEMPIDKTFERQCKAYHGMHEYTSDEQKDELAERLSGQLFYYNQVGTVSESDIYSYIDFCAEKLECVHIMVDSLMMINFGVDRNAKYERQKNFIAELSARAKAHNVHIHLVTHFRKPEKHTNKKSIYDVSGGSEVVNLCDNIFIIQKNETKQDLTEPDIFLSLGAQREGKEHWHWGIKHKENHQFLDCNDSMSWNKEGLSRGSFR